jgi:hypothetical protein
LEKIVTNSLGGFLPVCLNCKSIWTRRVRGYAPQEYITDRSEADFTHDICLACLKKLGPRHFK